MHSEAKIIVALDFDDKNSAQDLIEKLDPRHCRLKVGKEMFTLFGPNWVSFLQDKGFEIFLDLKFHDIPTTVAKAVRAAADLGVWMVNVHASGGQRMMESAKEALIPFGSNAPKLIAVTVLTSMSEVEFQSLGYRNTIAEQVDFLAQLTNASGLDGVVCSAHEAKLLNQKYGAGFVSVTPGIRPNFAATGDQSRIMTPSAALENGASYLVIGRPITQASDPAEALNKIYTEVTNWQKQGTVLS